MFQGICSSFPEFCSTIEGLLVFIIILAAIIVSGAIILLALAARDVRQANIPPDADFFETMRMIPITVPLALDMLDFVFDVFAAPLS